MSLQTFYCVWVWKWNVLNKACNCWIKHAVYPVPP
jgi:hypothetical protein